jgi:hypothetical protein
MFRSIYIFFAVTGVLCLVIKLAYHFYKRIIPFDKTSFIIPGTQRFLAMIYGFLPLKYIPNDLKENKIRKALNYGLFYYYSVVIVLSIGDSQFNKILQEQTPKQPVMVIDSNSIVKPLSDSEKSALKDSFKQALKKPSL